jgi:hypothetical protein
VQRQEYDRKKLPVSENKIILQGNVLTVLLNEVQIDRSAHQYRGENIDPSEIHRKGQSAQRK